MGSIGPLTARDPGDPAWWLPAGAVPGAMPGACKAMGTGGDSGTRKVSDASAQEARATSDPGLTEVRVALITSVFDAPVTRKSAAIPAFARSSRFSNLDPALKL